MRFTTSAFVATVLLVVTSTANACSVCIAHALGAALSGLGAQTLAHDKTTISLSYLHFSKSNGTDVAGVTEHEDYSQYALDFNRGITDRITLRGTLPFLSKSISTTGMGTERSSGLGDASIGVLWQVPPTPSAKALAAFSFDVKLPTGNSHAHDSGGGLKEQHLQLGSGSTDVVFGVDLTREGHKPGELFYGGIKTRWNGTNNRKFHYGDVIFYGIGYLRSLCRTTSVALEFNGRIADKDKVENGVKDPDSGGHLGYLSLSVRHSLRDDLGLIFSVQQPVWKQLNGSQDEKTLVSVSLNKVF